MGSEDCLGLQSYIADVDFARPLRSSAIDQVEYCDITEVVLVGGPSKHYAYSEGSLVFLCADQLIDHMSLYTDVELISRLICSI